LFERIEQFVRRERRFLLAAKREVGRSLWHSVWFE
jgi:hypothetical protein